MLCNECSLFRPTFRIILRACFSLNIARESMPLINLKRWQDFARPQLPNCSRFEWSSTFKTKLLHTTLSETSGILHSAYNLRRSWYARSESYILRCVWATMRLHLKFTSANNLQSPIQTKSASGAVPTKVC